MLSGIVHKKKTLKCAKVNACLFATHLFHNAPLSLFALKDFEQVTNCNSTKLCLLVVGIRIPMMWPHLFVDETNMNIVCNSSLVYLEETYELRSKAVIEG